MRYSIGGIVPGGGSLIPFGAQKPNLALCEVYQEGNLALFAPPLYWVLIFQSQQGLTPHYSQIPMDQGVDKGVTKNLLVSNCDLSVLEKCVGHEASVQAPLENKEDMKSLGMIHDHENNKIGVVEAITPPEKLQMKILHINTPRENIFDPFAPRPEEVACAPKKKVIRVPEVPSRRQQGFDSGDYPVKRLNYEFDDCEEDDQFLERVCKMFIDLIISKQALDTTGEGLIDSSSPVSCETPSSAPLLTGIADVCLDAPLRQSVKVVQVSPRQLFLAAGASSHSAPKNPISRRARFVAPIHTCCEVLIFQVTARVHSQIPMDQRMVKGVTENLLVSNYDFLVVEKCVGDKASMQAPLENKEDMKSLGMVHDLENNKIGVAEAITPPEKEAIESSISVKVANEYPSYGCQTPRENIFDPFALGPEEVACAPKKKVIKVPEVPSRRQLSFDSGEYPVKRLNYEFDDCEEDDQFLERICKMFIDLIISKQALETTGEGLIDSSSPVRCETPTSAPLLTGIADVCPDAPLRQPVKAVQLSPSICRKLNFDSISPRSLFIKENK
uniref:Uncharacterized protein n=1 Tax=Leersia perrieri TaxID=77586 RepID=A0A0D9XNH9_9ORYZ